MNNCFYHTTRFSGSNTHTGLSCVTLWLLGSIMDVTQRCTVSRRAGLEDPRQLHSQAESQTNSSVSKSACLSSDPCDDLSSCLPPVVWPVTWLLTGEHPKGIGEFWSGLGSQRSLSLPGFTNLGVSFRDWLPILFNCFAVVTPFRRCIFDGWGLQPLVERLYTTWKALDWIPIPHNPGLASTPVIQHSGSRGRSFSVTQ